MKKYIVSSVFLAAVVFSFGMQVSAQTNDSIEVKLRKANEIKANIKVESDDSATKTRLCQKIDANKDGKIDAQDFTAFQKLHNSGDLAADLDGSGSLTANDFMAFQNGYASCVKTTSTSGNTDPKKQITGERVKPVDDNSRKIDGKTEDRPNYRQRLLQLDSMHTKFVRIADLIGKRIAELESQKIDVSLAKTNLSSARDHLLKAKNSIDIAIKLHTSVGTVNAEIIASAKTAQSELVEARKSLTAATKALRMHDKSSDDSNKPVLSAACKVIDMNSDNKIDPKDFTAFHAAFTANDKRADADASGSLTANDYMAFMNIYAGCVRS